MKKPNTKQVTTDVTMKGDAVIKTKEAEDKYRDAKKLMSMEHRTQKTLEQAIGNLTDAITLLQNFDTKNKLSAQLHSARANVYMETGQYQLALIDYYHSIRVDPQASYFCLRGNCFQKLNETKSALDDFNTAIQKAEKDKNPKGAYYLDRGLVYAKLKKYQEAIIDFDEALIFLKPQQIHQKFRAYFNLGNCLRKIKEFDKSIEMLQQACSIKPENSVACNNLGLSLFEAKEFEKANEQFKRAINYDNKNAIYYNNIALCYYHENDNENAIKHFEQAIYLDPEEPKAYYNLGNTYLAQGNREKAHEFFDKALRKDEKNCKIYHSKGLAYQDANEYKNAIRMFLKALTLDQTHTPSKYHLGLMQHKNGEFKEALHSFTEVLKEVGEDRLVYESRGLVYQDMKNHDFAIKDFNTSIKIEPNYSLVYYYRGLSRIELRKLDLAIKDFMMQLPLHSLFIYLSHRSMELGEQDNPSILSGIGCAYRINRDFKKSQYYLNRALQLSPKNYEFLMQRAQVYIDIKQYELGITDQTKALRLHKNDPQIYYRRGLSHYLNCNYIQCIKDLKKSLINEPFFSYLSNIYYHIGISYSNLNKFKKSLQNFSLALQLQKEEPRYYHERAKSYLLTKQFELSLEDFDKTIELQPDNAHAYFGRAFSHKALHHFDEAAQDWEKAQELEPENSNLIVNYRFIQNIEYIQLCLPGDEMV